MPHHATSSTHDAPPARPRVQRARSLPTARPFREAVFFTALFFLGLIATVTAGFCVIEDPNPFSVRIMVGAMAFSVVTWLISFFKRRSTFCPLCKGTPLLNSGARVHQKAWRLHPLNHGMTATLSILACQKFRCMFCGSDYDLLKSSSRLHGDAADHES